MRTLSVLSFSVLLLATPAIAASDAPVEVMIVGGFHMAGGHDLHDVDPGDVLAPKRQMEIQAIVDGVAKFKPTMVDAEWDAPVVATRYPDFLSGKLPPSHNEVVQLGFHLAKQMNVPMHGIDADGDFPYDAVLAYAKAHGSTGLLDSANNDVQHMVDKTNDILKNGTISEALRFLNDPKNIAHDNDFYRTTLLIGDGATQPGADLLAAWYKRNFYICAHIVQLAKPGDRVVLFYGSGHAFLLRQCVREMPGYKLVEANDYLPK